MCRAFFEAAWNHAEHLGVGHAELAERNKLWVLGRLLLQIDQCPRWGESGELTTWPRGTSGAFALRDFEIHKEDTTRLAAGTSSWLVLEASTHRPQRLDKLLQEIRAPVRKMALGREACKLTGTIACDATMVREVRYSDVDINQHVNSARYIGWLLDSYSRQFYQSHTLRRIEVNYLAETRWPDSVSIRSQTLSNAKIVHSIAKSDGQEVCRAELEWTVEYEKPTD
jgi:acyl-ACP thioesterase